MNFTKNATLLAIALCLSFVHGGEKKNEFIGKVSGIPNPASDCAEDSADSSKPKPTDRTIKDTIEGPYAIKGWKQKDICTIQGPGDVQNYRFKCTGATYFDFRVADCCLPYDHWQLKGKSWDAAPNTAVTTSPGPKNVYGVPARIYNYPSFKTIDVLVECSYLHGVSIFTASSYVYFSSDGDCVDLGGDLYTRIDRSP